MNDQGNIKANSYWECNVLTFEKPLAHDPLYVLLFIINTTTVPTAKNTLLINMSRKSLSLQKATQRTNSKEVNTFNIF
jgi:hypothetical protein